MFRKHLLLNTVGAALIMLLANGVSAADTSTVLIKGPNVSITSADLLAEVSRIPEKDRTDFLTDVKRANSTLEQMYMTKELSHQAEVMKLQDDPLVQDKLRLAREKVLAQERMAVLEKGLKIPDFTQRAKELYLTEKEKYRFEPTAKATHILISWKQLDKDSAQSDKDAALKKAQAVRAEITSGTKTFEEAAKAYTEDPSGKEKQGDLGWFDAKRVVKPFGDAVFAMKPGDISQPVETRFGYHIIRLDEKKPGGYTPFEEVKQMLITQLTGDYVQAARSLLLNEIKGDKRIVVNTDAIVKLNPKANLVVEKAGTSQVKKP